jgi:hypothetical protein
MILVKARLLSGLGTIRINHTISIIPSRKQKDKERGQNDGIIDGKGTFLFGEASESDDPDLTG